jgi:hypothetical protein
MKSTACRAVQFVLLVCILLTFSTRHSAADDWPPISPDELAMTGIAEQPGAPAVILFRQEIDDDTQHYHSLYVRLKILTEAGRKYADIRVAYDRNHSVLGQISGRTVHADGTIVPFSGTPFDKTVVSSHGVRYHEKVFTIPDVQVGSIVDYRYYVRYPDNLAYAPEWIVQDDLFQRKATFKFTPYPRELIIARGRNSNGVSWTPFLPKGHALVVHQTPHADFVGTKSFATWIDLQLDNIPAFVEEPHMPPAQLLKWRVSFYYQVEDNQNDYWKNQGKYWNKEVEGFMGRNKDASRAAGQMVLVNDTPEQKVHKIYASIIKLENQSYMAHRPEQEAKAVGLKPNAGADDVLRQHSGDHDELNRLFVSMVRAAGVPAWLMLVPDRSEDLFVPQFLSTRQFDAEIAIVQLDGKELFLDPGTKYCPYGMLNWRYSGVRGLRQNQNNGTEFGETPVPDYKKSKVQRVAHVSLTEQGVLEGTVTVGYYGLEAMNRRHDGGRTDDAGRTKLLEDEMRSWIPGNSEVTLTNTPQWDETESPLEAEFKISSPFATGAGKRMMIAPDIFQFNQEPLFPASQRSNPIYFYFPSSETDDLHIVLPPGVEVQTMPSDDETHLDYAVYKTERSKESSNTLLVHRELVMDGMSLSADKYGEVKSFYDRVRAVDNQRILLRAAAHAEGN